MPLERHGVKVKRARQQRGLTQAALAEKAEIHRIYLRQIEAGTKIPSIPTLMQIAKALGVKAGRLLE